MEMKKEVNEKVELIEKVEQPNFSVENIRETRPVEKKKEEVKERRRTENRQNIKLNGEYYSGRWFDYRPQKKRRRNLFG